MDADAGPDLSRLPAARGTGSNVCAKHQHGPALARLGHEVHLLCQDLDAASLPWVDSVGRWEGGKLGVEEHVNKFARIGLDHRVPPDIGGILPVYVTVSVG